MNEFQDFLVKFLTAFALALIPVVVPLVVAKVKQWLAQAKEVAKEWRPELYQALDMGAKLAVTAAEQAGLAGLIKEKKDYAINALEAYLAEFGYNVDVDVIDAAIEAAVNEAAFPHAEK